MGGDLLTPVSLILHLVTSLCPPDGKIIISNLKDYKQVGVGWDEA